MGIELYVYNLLVVRARYGDSGGESDLYWGVHGGDHGICVGVCHRYDEVDEL